MDFGEAPLANPVVVPERTSDECHPTALLIWLLPKPRIRVEFTRGTGTGAGYKDHSNDNVTLRNENDEQGEPDPSAQDWDDLVGGTEIATWVNAQGTPTNGAVLKRFAEFILAEKGVV